MIVYYTVPAGVVHYLIAVICAKQRLQSVSASVRAASSSLSVICEINSVLVADLRSIHTVGMVCHTASLIDYISRLYLILHSLRWSMVRQHAHRDGEAEGKGDGRNHAPARQCQYHQYCAEQSRH